MTEPKIVVIGALGSGKTTLINRYLTGTFERRYLRTLGVNVQGAVWDIAGPPNELFDGYLFGATHGILVIDGSIKWNAKQQKQQNTLIKHLKRVEPNTKISVIITKTDQSDEKNCQNIVQYIIKKGYKCTKTSAKTGECPLEFNDLLA